MPLPQPPLVAVEVCSPESSLGAGSGFGGFQRGLFSSPDQNIPNVQPQVLRRVAQARGALSSAGPPPTQQSGEGPDMARFWATGWAPPSRGTPCHTRAPNVWADPALLPDSPLWGWDRLQDKSWSHSGTLRPRESRGLCGPWRLREATRSLLSLPGTSQIKGQGGYLERKARLFSRALEDRPSSPLPLGPSAGLPSAPADKGPWLKAGDQVWAGLAPPEAPLLGVQPAVLAPCPHMALPLCLCPDLLLFLGHQSHRIRSTPRTSFYFNYLFKDPRSKYSHILIWAST